VGLSLKRYYLVRAATFLQRLFIGSNRQSVEAGRELPGKFMAFRDKAHRSFRSQNYIHRPASDGAVILALAIIGENSCLS
jgi:hypothetical protein